MPLVKLFARNSLTKAVPLGRLQLKLCEIWGTQPSTTKLMLVRCEDWTDESFQEDVFVDIRAYGTFFLSTNMCEQRGGTVYRDATKTRDGKRHLSCKAFGF